MGLIVMVTQIKTAKCVVRFDCVIVKDNLYQV